MGNIKVEIEDKQDIRLMVTGSGRESGDIRFWVIDKETDDGVYITVDEIKEIMRGEEDEEGIITDKGLEMAHWIKGERFYRLSEGKITVEQSVYGKNCEVTFGVRDFIEGVDGAVSNYLKQKRNIIQRTELRRLVDSMKEEVKTWG